MKRLKFIFAFLLLILALPFWRFADMIAILSPFEFPLTFSLILWFGLFVALPTKLLWNRIKVQYLIGAAFFFGGITFALGPWSDMATTDPNFNHCGRTTYTGVFYPLRKITSDAHHDDLEARNQLCWIRKMISRVPTEFKTEIEVDQYTALVQEKLFRPEIKYRASLPMIAALYVRINTAWGEMIAGKKIYDSLHFWTEHYTDEIQLRNYSAWSWPHSSYIKFEYGLIERNWQSLIDSIVLEVQK